MLFATISIPPAPHTPPMGRHHTTLIAQVVSAPTGGGKTAIMELAILRLLSGNVCPASGAYRPRPGAAKTLYLGPVRALVQERMRDWQQRLGKMGVACAEMSGDIDASSRDVYALDTADVICATPECFGARFKGGGCDDDSHVRDEKLGR